MKTRIQLRIVAISLILSVCVPSTGVLSQSNKCSLLTATSQTIVSNHDFVFSKPAAEPLQGLLMGNGDLGVSVWADGDTLVFSIGKNDVWDRRFNTSHDAPVATYSELVGKVGKGEWVFNDYYYSQPVESNFSPMPKQVGQLRLSGLGEISNIHFLEPVRRSEPPDPPIRSVSSSH